MNTNKDKPIDALRELNSLNRIKDDHFSFWDLPIVKLIPMDGGKAIVKQLSHDILAECSTPMCDNLAEFLFVVVRDAYVGEVYTSPCCKKDKDRLSKDAEDGTMTIEVLQ